MRRPTPSRGRGKSSSFRRIRLTVSVHARVRQFLLDAMGALSPGPKAANVLLVTHLPCLMVLDQVLPQVDIDLDMDEKAHNLDIQPEQVGVVRLLKQGTRWSGEAEHQ